MKIHPLDRKVLSPAPDAGAFPGGATAVITLLTDFGSRDSYAAEMKGVILKQNPRATIVDVTHDIRPGAVREAAWVLFAAHAAFPDGTVHAVVVDPGVGSARRIICAKTPRGFFIGPDNGVLAFVLPARRDGPVRRGGRKDRRTVVREVTNASFFRKPVSAVFHGRDKIAPVAACLAVSPRDFHRLGPVYSPRPFAWPRPFYRGRALRGEILHTDRFGNLITNFLPADLKGRAGRPGGFKVTVREHAARNARYYSEGRPGELLAIAGSTGFLEIALRDGSAAERTGARTGDAVRAVFYRPLRKGR